MTILPAKGDRISARAANTPDACRSPRMNSVMKVLHIPAMRMVKMDEVDMREKQRSL